MWRAKDFATVAGSWCEGKMALRTSRIVRKYAPFYSRVRDSEGSDSDGGVRAGGSGRSSFTWPHPACLSGLTHVHHVPLSESPKRELRMRSVTKARRHHGHSKKQKKQFPRLWW